MCEDSISRAPQARLMYNTTQPSYDCVIREMNCNAALPRVGEVHLQSCSNQGSRCGAVTTDEGAGRLERAEMTK